MPTMSAHPAGVSPEGEAAEERAVAGTAPAATGGLPSVASVAVVTPQNTGLNRSWFGLVAQPEAHTHEHSDSEGVLALDASVPCAPHVEAVQFAIVVNGYAAESWRRTAVSGTAVVVPRTNTTLTRQQAPLRRSAAVLLKRFV